MNPENGGTAITRRVGLARLLLALAAAALIASAPGAPRRSAAQESLGIVASAVGTYDVHPDEPAVDIRWEIALENTGPPPWAEYGDLPFYPDSVDVYLQGSPATFHATGPGGQALSTSFVEIGGSTIATVSLGRALRYGETYSFSYGYQITESGASYYSVRPSYISIYATPGIGIVDMFRSSTVTITVPSHYADYTLISAEGCTEYPKPPNTVFDCQSDSEWGIAADIEVVNPEARRATSQDIEISGRSMELILRYFPEDAAWADNVTQTTIAAIPVLEDLIGAPFPGPDKLRISEKGGQEIWGAAGVAACDNYMCGIAVRPDAGEQTLLHELVHVWTGAFRNRWLSEGTAEHISLKAAERMGFAAPASYEPGDESPLFPLDEWGSPVSFLTAGADVLEREYAGYEWSARFLMELEARTGPEPLRAAYAELVTAARDTVSSKRFMDTVEDAGGGNADDLFQRFIFPPDVAADLAERRAVRDRLSALAARAAAEAPELPQDDALTPAHEDIGKWDFGAARAKLDTVEPGFESYLLMRDKIEALRAAATEAGLAFPVPFDNALRTWNVSPIADSVDAGFAAIDTYAAARGTVMAPRSLWQKIGLFGKSPRSQLSDAAGAFAWADFDGSIEKSRAAEATVDGAAGAALKHGLIAAGVLVTLVVVSALLLRWALRDEPAPANSGSDA